MYTPGLSGVNLGTCRGGLGYLIRVQEMLGLKLGTLSNRHGAKP